MLLKIWNILVAIPSKPGQRLQLLGQQKPDKRLDCRNPFQTRSTTSMWTLSPAICGRGEWSQSLPNQVNDFNSNWSYGEPKKLACRNPFQTRSTTSITEVIGETMSRNYCRNPFQTRSTTSIIEDLDGNVQMEDGRNPFQTRSTTSIKGIIDVQTSQYNVSQSLPNQVNDFNQPTQAPVCRGFGGSQSLPNQVNDFNGRKGFDGDVEIAGGRNPFQTRSTTSIKSPSMG